jgi:dipeptidyl aminopeptidase/acylaminoacyl peptidase
MTNRTVAPYGSWKSPITSELIVAGSIGLGQVQPDGENIYWLEMRPAEKGRYVIVRRTADGTISDVTPPQFNVRNRIHEYGGGAYTVRDGHLIFTNFADQNVFAQSLTESTSLLFASQQHDETNTSYRFADFDFDLPRQRVYCIRERHATNLREAENTVACINLKDGSQQVIASGHDFFAAPRLSPDGNQLVWITWDHPHMPWDESLLWLARVNADGSLSDPHVIAGGLGASIVQPQWSPDGVLHFVSDRYGWWNLYRYRQQNVESLCRIEAEFGVPQWVFNQSTYAFLNHEEILCAYIERGAAHLGLLNTTSGKLEKINTPFTSIGNVRASSGVAVFTAASPTQSTAIYRFDPATRQVESLRVSSSLNVGAGYISEPQAIEYPTENNLTAHAFYFPPHNQDFVAPANEKPPLLVMSHGGPTSQHFPVFNLEIQYWTSRGFGVLDVNYGGSTGYGREYRERLRGNWGIVDVSDCANGAKYLAAQGLADVHRLAITGGSAGGYTTLCALTFSDVFSAGASHYGVSDLIALDEDTHKFESRYTQSLVGPWPESRDLYIARSPIHHTDKLSAPVIFFQGLEDKIVPPNQAEMMVNALRQKGLPVAYLTFEGEQHGFRQAANIRRALDGEFYFYARVFGFAPADNIEPVMIENMSQ